MQIKRIFNEIFNNLESDVEEDVANQCDADSLEETLNLLYVYIETELDGKDASSAFPDIADAIVRDPEARERYHDLKEILEAERKGTLEIPSQMPTFDFSYLHLDPVLEPEQDWRWNELGQLVIEFSERLIASLRQPMALQLATQGNHLKSKNGERMLFNYEVDQTENADLFVRIYATTTISDPAKCDVSISIDRPSLEGVPLMADTRIIIDGVGTETFSQSTDPFGKTVVRNMAVDQLPSLRFCIEPVAPMY